MENVGRLVGILERTLFEERFSKACYAWSVASHSRERFEVIPSFQAVIRKRTINDRGNLFGVISGQSFLFICRAICRSTKIAIKTNILYTAEGVKQRRILGEWVKRERRKRAGSELLALIRKKGKKKPALACFLGH